MKNLIFAAIVMFGMNANASWYQIYCSNAAGTVKTATGHGPSYNKATRTYVENNKVKTQEVEFGWDEVEVKIVSSTEVSRTSSASCGQSGNGISEWQNIELQRIQITKADGSKFKDGYAGLSSDMKMIEATILCEENGNSMMFCDSKN